MNLILVIKFSGDFSSRKTRPEIRVKCVQFSPTGKYLFVYSLRITQFFLSLSLSPSSPSGRAWAAASTEGMLIYFLDEGVVFDPYDLSEDVTPEGVAKALEEGNFSAALIMSFRLNEKNLLINSLEATPISDSKFTACNNYSRSRINQFLTPWLISTVAQQWSENFNDNR